MHPDRRLRWSHQRPTWPSVVPWARLQALEAGALRRLIARGSADDPSRPGPDPNRGRGALAVDPRHQGLKGRPQAARRQRDRNRPARSTINGGHGAQFVAIGSPVRRTAEEQGHRHAHQDRRPLRPPHDRRPPIRRREPRLLLAREPTVEEGHGGLDRARQRRRRTARHARRRPRRAQGRRRCRGRCRRRRRDGRCRHAEPVAPQVVIAKRGPCALRSSAMATSTAEKVLIGIGALMGVSIIGGVIVELYAVHKAGEIANNTGTNGQPAVINLVSPPQGLFPVAPGTMVNFVLPAAPPGRRRAPRPRRAASGPSRHRPRRRRCSRSSTRAAAADHLLLGRRRREPERGHRHAGRVSISCLPPAPPASAPAARCLAPPRRPPSTRTRRRRPISRPRCSRSSLRATVTSQAQPLRAASRAPTRQRSRRTRRPEQSEPRPSVRRSTLRARRT